MNGTVVKKVTDGKMHGFDSGGAYCLVLHELGRRRVS